MINPTGKMFKFNLVTKDGERINSEIINGEQTSEGIMLFLNVLAKESTELTVLSTDEVLRSKDIHMMEIIIND